MNKTIKILLVLVMIALIGSLLVTILGVSFLFPIRSSIQETTQSEIGKILPADYGLANPASTYCFDQGFSLEILEDTAGNQYGMCVFPDGFKCEEWSFFRGECTPIVED
jgi:putative hemolysin